MAPNLAVKSESWLDLTASVPAQVRAPAHVDPSTRRWSTSSPAAARKQPARGLEHSLAGAGQSTCSSNSRMNLSSKSQVGIQQQVTSSREHLLIRLRQQSYMNNRSNSSASLASNLSHSIELNEFVGNRHAAARASSLNELTIDGRRLQDLSQSIAATEQQQQQQPPTTTRLERMKAKLGRGGARSRIPAKATSGALSQAAMASPLARSLSSFSERLGDKFDHLRSSWKHFLYNYNQQKRYRATHYPTDAGQLNADELGAETVEQQVDEPEALRDRAVSASVDKRRLTGLWIERHQGNWVRDRSDQLSRPRSLDISAHTQLARQCDGETFSAKFDARQLSSKTTNPSTAFDHTRFSSEAQTNFDRSSKEDSAFVLRQSRSSSSTTTTTTTTLVSKPPASLESISSASTINSAARRTTMDGKQKQVADKKEQTSTALAAFEAEEESRAAPTSDYWSTLASSDYYKRLMAGQQQQQMTLKVPCQPMLLTGDHSEYYMDVANAASATKLSQQRRSPDAKQLEQQMLLAHQQQDLTTSHMIAAPDMIGQQRLMAPARLQPTEFADADYCDDDYAVPADESCRLERSQVELVQMIGEGQKGYVFLGKLQSKDGVHIQDVAIKTLKYETEQLIEKLMREAAMMRQFEHPHIIKFIGVCPETPALIAMELAEFGEVKQYLKLNKHLICASQLVLFTFQISTALSYLESKQFVHRDVAARNVLVCSHSCVKLADFGLSRSLQQSQCGQQQQQQQVWHSELIGDQQYVAAARGKLPVRWLAPESLAFRRFTSASDVWMFAVCSWELFQFGQVRPWAQIRNNQVLLAIESGQRLAKPPTCPARLYQLMLQCWSYAPVQRPKFRDLKQSLWSIYLTERAREQMELEQQQQLQLQHQLQMQQQQLQFQQQQQLEQLHLQRRMLAADRYLRQQQLQQQQQRNQDQKLMMLWQNQQQQSGQNMVCGFPPTSDQRFSASPSHANYSSNMSGYSSTTATVDLSNNSSRSSSMGSLARNSQQQQQHQLLRRQQHVSAQQQKHQVQVAAPQPLTSPPLVSSQSAEDANHQALQREQEKRQRIERNVRRFQRTPGHLLQKQRSQDSIANLELHHKRAQAQMRQHQLSGLGVDQSSVCAARRRRPLSELHLAREVAMAADNDDEDSNGDDDSSDGQVDSVWKQPPGWRLQQHAPAVDHRQHARHVPLVEPTYEGVQAGELASCGVSHLKCAERQLPKGQALLDAEAEALTEEEAGAAGHRKLHNMLQSLKISPMKAKLTYNNQQTSETSASSEVKQLPQGRLDEQRQLAVHQRLLGHIRPGLSNRTQREAKQTGARAPVGRAESVDQSLQLLESLISERNFSRTASSSVDHDTTGAATGGSPADRSNSRCSGKSQTPNAGYPQQQQMLFGRAAKSPSSARKR